MSYSRWERFVFWSTGRWPQSVVDRRLDQLAATGRYIWPSWFPDYLRSAREWP